MADQIDFDDWGGGGEDSGNRLVDADPNSAMKRAAYQGNRLMMRADGSPIPQEVPAQFRQPAPQQPPRPAPQTEMNYQEFEQFVAEQETQARSIQETFTEAERRFDKAKYYKLLLGQPIFSDSSVAGQEVEAEVRAFAQERFEVFLGMRQERGAIPEVFTGWERDDFDALLILVRRLRQKPELAAAAKPAGPPAEPTITPRAPTAPAAKPEPALRPRAPIDTQKLGQNPLAPAPARPQAQAPQGKPQRQPKGPRQRKLKPLIDPYTGQVKINPETGQPMVKDVTPQVRPPPGADQPIPMPSSAEGIAALHASKASEAAANLETKLARAGEAGMVVRAASAYAANTGLGGHHGEVVYDGADYRPDASMMVASDNEGGVAFRNS